RSACREYAAEARIGYACRAREGERRNRAGRRHRRDNGVAGRAPPLQRVAIDLHVARLGRHAGGLEAADALAGPAIVVLVPVHCVPVSLVLGPGRPLGIARLPDETRQEATGL